MKIVKLCFTSSMTADAGGAHRVLLAPASNSIVARGNVVWKIGIPFFTRTS